MMKKLALCVAFVAGTAACVSMMGCDDETGNNGSQDMAMNGNTDLAMNGGQDMAFACVQNPMTNDDFLNSCAPASVDKVDLVPFYPTLAPNGQLPTLQ